MKIDHAGLIVIGLQPLAVITPATSNLVVGVVVPIPIFPLDKILIASEVGTPLAPSVLPAKNLTPAAPPMSKSFVEAPSSQNVACVFPA